MSKYGRDKNYYYSQENNPHEQLLTFIVNNFKEKIDKTLFLKLKNELHLLWILETCGPTAMVNCIAALIGDGVNKWPGLQPEGCVMNYFISPENWPAFQKIRPLDFNEYLPNRVPQYYSYVAKQLFNIKASYYNTDYLNDIAELLINNHTVQACLKSPGHYIAMVDYDDKTDEIIYNDSWPHRPGLKNAGFNERMGKDEFSNNVNNFFIIYYAS